MPSVYAIRGYEVDALGFVVKPVRYYDFRLRMDKAMRTLARNAGFSVTIPRGRWISRNVSP